MQCPKCNEKMETVNFKNIQVDRCTSCYGLWFDILEKEDLKKIEGAESIDVGDEQIGKEYNKIRKIECPKCHATMIPMVDREQVHIQYESCPSCYGTFFDAGEFSDFKEHTVIDRFRDMVETIRSNL